MGNTPTTSRAGRDGMGEYRAATAERMWCRHAKQHAQATCSKAHLQMAMRHPPAARCGPPRDTSAALPCGLHEEVGKVYSYQRQHIPCRTPRYLFLGVAAAGRASAGGRSWPSLARCAEQACTTQVWCTSIDITLAGPRQAHQRK